MLLYIDIFAGSYFRKCGLVIKVFDFMLLYLCYLRLKQTVATGPVSWPTLSISQNRILHEDNIILINKNEFY